MTEHEKKLIQARTMTTDDLEEYLCSTLRTK